MNATIDDDGALVIVPDNQHDADKAFKWFQLFQQGGEDCQAILMVETDYVTTDMIGGDTH